MKENLNDIFIKTNSLDLWWGIYGLAPLTGWEDIYLLDSSEENAKRLGYFCVCTKNYLGNDLEDLEQDPEEKQFVEQIKLYLEDDTIHYNYGYDNPLDDDFFQLSYYNLPRNKLGIKPSYIEMWHPNIGIDKQVIEECVREFCLNFLNVKVNQIHYIEAISIEKAINTYTERITEFRGKIDIEFTENLVQTMMKKLSKTKEEVINIISKSM